MVEHHRLWYHHRLSCHRVSVAVVTQAINVRPLSFRIDIIILLAYIDKTSTLWHHGSIVLVDTRRGWHSLGILTIRDDSWMLDCLVWLDTMAGGGGGSEIDGSIAEVIDLGRATSYLAEWRWNLSRFEILLEFQNTFIPKTQLFPRLVM